MDFLGYMSMRTTIRATRHSDVTISSAACTHAHPLVHSLHTVQNTHPASCWHFFSDPSPLVLSLSLSPSLPLSLSLSLPPSPSLCFNPAAALVLQISYYLNVQSDGYLALVAKVGGAEFIRRQIGMLKELLTNYGPVNRLWFDGTTS